VVNAVTCALKVMMAAVKDTFDPSNSALATSWSP
jgi:hypothetical protein